MADDALLERISIDGAVAGGRPTVRGHRIWVSLILDLLADGVPVDEILGDYPGLEVADVRACMAYGAWLAAGHLTDNV